MVKLSAALFGGPPDIVYCKWFGAHLFQHSNLFFVPPHSPENFFIGIRSKYSIPVLPVFCPLPVVS